LAKNGEVGTVRTIPEGIAPGSDAANMAVMGYDPEVYLTGRSPLEAVSMGLTMTDTDVAFRTNLVTLKGEGEYEDLTIIDHSAGDITSEEAKILINDIDEALGTDSYRFYPGVSYRHALIMRDGRTDFELTPPHDIINRTVREYLPKGNNPGFITELMRKSYEILKDHPVNKKRIEKGLNPANSIWIWGQGKKPNLVSFSQKYGIKGSVVSAVDLIKGIGLCAGLSSVDIDGATGTIDTNYRGKVDAAIGEFNRGSDFVYVHVEAPDECSHQGNTEEKVRALELIDKEVVSPLMEYLKSQEDDYKVLVVPDHRTPLAIRTHSDEPVPFVIYDSRSENYCENNQFTEDSGRRSKYFEKGSALADYFFN
jgi:2,3-bisphosphoglycerate-independent phosphoglycerate mutase